MGLHIDERAAEQLLGPFNRQRFSNIYMLASAIVAAARVSLCILVCQDAALGFQNGFADDVFRGNQLNLVLLALQFPAQRRKERRIGLSN